MRARADVRWRILLVALAVGASASIAARGAGEAAPSGAGPIVPPANAAASVAEQSAAMPTAVLAALERDDTAALRAALAALSRAESVDAATAALAAALESLPRNAAFRARLEQAARAPTPVAAPIRHAYLFVMVPGWRYRINPETGADLARPRATLERLGFTTHAVPIDQNGTVDDNARALADELAALEGTGRRLVLVSTSKGGPEAQLALAELDRAGRSGHVAAWVNIGGLLHGTAIADWWARAPQRWLAWFGFALQGFGIASIDSMTTAVSRARAAAAPIPAHVLLVNYLAVPLSHEVSAPARNGYDYLAEHGPNDGLTLLADAIAPGGVTVVARGLDHFYAAPDIDWRVATMAAAIVGLLEARAEAPASGQGELVLPAVRSGSSGAP